MHASHNSLGIRGGIVISGARDFDAFGAIYGPAKNNRATGKAQFY
jgi:hypothetical protein